MYNVSNTVIFLFFGIENEKLINNIRALSIFMVILFIVVFVVAIIYVEKRIVKPISKVTNFIKKI